MRNNKNYYKYRLKKLIAGGAAVTLILGSLPSVTKAVAPDPADKILAGLLAVHSELNYKNVDELKKLLESGEITEEEFNTLKAKVLAESSTSSESTASGSSEASGQDSTASSAEGTGSESGSGTESTGSGTESGSTIESGTGTESGTTTEGGTESGTTGTEGQGSGTESGSTGAEGQGSSTESGSTGTEGQETGTGTEGQGTGTGSGTTTPTNPEGATTNPDGTITYPDGSVKNLDGTITYPDGSIKYADGSVKKPDGTVTYPDGTVKNPDGTIKNPDGTTTNPDGSLTREDGSIVQPDGTVIKPNGIIIHADGTVTFPEGTITNEDGTVTLPDGTIVDPENPEGKDPAEVKDPEEEELETDGIPKEGSNEDLLKTVQIVHAPEIKPDFRFKTVEKQYAFAKEACNVRETNSDRARIVGSLEKNGYVYVLDEVNGGWLYVESGNVRGFVRKEYFHINDQKSVKLQKMLEAQDLPARLARLISLRRTEPMPEEAEELVPRLENKGYAYKHITTQETVVEKVYALPTEDRVEIRENPKEESREVGILNENGICYVLADRDNEWVYVESGDVRGFVRQDEIMIELPSKPIDPEEGEEVDKEPDPVIEAVEAKGEDNFELAEEILKPEENKSVYYTFSSIREYSEKGHVRQAMMEYAAQFLGNPYVWGGTSLTNGCDCSGFCQQIYAAFGYSIPRVSRDQAYAGIQIPVEEAQPGDLIFYAKNGYIYHVVMSTGNGGTIEAMGRAHGIVNSYVKMGNAVWACRIIDDDADTR